jgi:hypothetical protein
VAEAADMQPRYEALNSDFLSYSSKLTNLAEPAFTADVSQQRHCSMLVKSQIQLVNLHNLELTQL